MVQSWRALDLKRRSILKNFWKCIWRHETDRKHMFSWEREVSVPQSIWLDRRTNVEIGWWPFPLGIFTRTKTVCCRYIYNQNSSKEEIFQGFKLWISWKSWLIPALRSKGKISSRPYLTKSLGQKLLSQNQMACSTAVHSISAWSQMEWTFFISPRVLPHFFDPEVKNPQLARANWVTGKDPGPGTQDVLWQAYHSWADSGQATQATCTSLLIAKG